MKYAFLSVLCICLTVIYVTWRIEKMQARRTMAAMQVVMRGK
jgi:hypothetical protein